MENIPKDEETFKQRMLILNSLLTDIGSSLERKAILKKGGDGAMDLVTADGVFVVMYSEKDLLTFPYANGLLFDAVDIELENTPSNREALGVQKPVIIDDISVYGKVLESFFKKHGVKSLMSVPLGSGDVLLGAIGVVALKQPRLFGPYELELLTILARGLTAAINNSILFDVVKESQKQWQATFDCITDAIIIQNEDSVILRSNMWAGRQCGMHPRELLGRKANEVFPLPPSVKEDPFLRAIRSGESSSFEVNQNGRDYIVSTFLVDDPRGERKTCVHVRKDVTELKRLQNQLFNTEKLRAVGSLVGGVAHEINNPLTGVIGYSELMLRKCEKDEDKRELEKILNSALRCKSIIENLLAFSRQKTQEKQKVDMNQVLDNTLDLRSYWLRRNNIEIVRHYAELPPVLADPQMIQQVFLNIIENSEQAIKDAHGPDGGELTIETFHASDRALISITDNGPGIDEDVISRVFEPFFSTREVGQGAGLGLSSSYGIVKEHGGDLRVQSQPGEGATFIIELPVRQVTPKVANGFAN